MDCTSEADVSSLRAPISCGKSDAMQIWHALKNGTQEVRHVIVSECRVILECKMCWSLFRGLPNLLAHKRVYCTELNTISPLVMAEMNAELNSVFVEPTDSDEDEFTPGPRLNQTDPMSKSGNVLQCQARIELTGIDATPNAVCQSITSMPETCATPHESDSNVIIIEPRSADGPLFMELRKRDTAPTIEAGQTGMNAEASGSVPSASKSEVFMELQKKDTAHAIEHVEAEQIEMNATASGSVSCGSKSEVNSICSSSEHGEEEIGSLSDEVTKLTTLSVTEFVTECGGSVETDQGLLNPADDCVNPSIPDSLASQATRAAADSLTSQTSVPDSVTYDAPKPVTHPSMMSAKVETQPGTNSVQVDAPSDVIVPVQKEMEHLPMEIETDSKSSSTTSKSSKRALTPFSSAVESVSTHSMSKRDKSCRMTRSSATRVRSTSRTTRTGKRKTTCDEGYVRPYRKMLSRVTFCDLKNLKCRKCDLSCTSFDKLKEHMMEKHVKTEMWSCPKCEDTFSCIASVKHHMFKVHKSMTNDKAFRQKGGRFGVQQKSESAASKKKPEKKQTNKKTKIVSKPKEHEDSNQSNPSSSIMPRKAATYFCPVKHCRASFCSRPDSVRRHLIEIHHIPKAESFKLMQPVHRPIRDAHCEKVPIHPSSVTVPVIKKTIITSSGTSDDKRITLYTCESEVNSCNISESKMPKEEDDHAQLEPSVNSHNVEPQALKLQNENTGEALKCKLCGRISLDSLGMTRHLKRLHPARTAGQKDLSKFILFIDSLTPSEIAEFSAIRIKEEDNSSDGFPDIQSNSNVNAKTGRGSSVFGFCNMNARHVDQTIRNESRSTGDVQNFPAASFSGNIGYSEEQGYCSTNNGTSHPGTSHSSTTVYNMPDDSVSNTQHGVDDGNHPGASNSGEEARISNPHNQGSFSITSSGVTLTCYKVSKLGDRCVFDFHPDRVTTVQQPSSTIKDSSKDQKRGSDDPSRNIRKGLK